MAKIICHRNYGIVTETMAKYLSSHTEKKSVKETFFIHINVSLVCFAGYAKDNWCLLHPRSLINASKPVKTLSHFPRQYRETLSNIFGNDLGLHEQI